MPIAPAIRPGSRRRDVPASGRAAASRRQPAGDAAAQPARFRRPQRRARSIAAARSRACILSDAAARGIADGDIVRLFNERGACLAGAASPTASGPASCSFRPAPGTTPPTRRRTAPLCVHGNPERADARRRHLALAQGCTGQLTTVEVERFDGNLPPIQAYDPPVTGEAAVQHGTGLQRQNDGGL